MNNKFLYILLAIGLLFIGIWYLSPEKDSPPTFTNLSPTVQYVGDEECAACHAEIYNSYTRTGMGRSFYPSKDVHVIEDYSSPIEIYDKQKDYFYTAALIDGEHVQIEYRLDDSGNRTHELTRKADHIIGSGNHNRSYLSETNGFVTQLPLTWYEDKKKWDLSPGYHSTNMRFSRPIVEECMHCHNSFTSVTTASIDRFDSDLPQGIGCERCHGPGDLHIQQRIENVPIAGNVDKSIVNPKHLLFQEQIDVCQQCHLQGEVSVFRDGYRSTDFRPGMQLATIKSIFMDTRQDHSQFSIASHAERLADSKCFKKSKTMTCITCHDPHVSVYEVNDAYFNNTCYECHSNNSLSSNIHETNDNCVKCHMVQGGTSDIPHVNFTDHKIQINNHVPSPPDPTHIIRTKQTVELENYFPSGDPVDLGVAYVQYYETRHQDKVYLAKALEIFHKELTDQNNNGSGWYHFGRAHQLLGENDKAKKSYFTLLSQHPDHYLANGQMGKISLDNGDYSSAIAFYKKCIQMDNNDPLIWNNIGTAFLHSGDAHSALNAYSTAISLNPYNTSALNNRGELLLYHFNEQEAGKTDLLTCLTNDPNHILALHNLGNVSILENDLVLAEKYALRAIEVDNSFIPPYGTLSTVYQKTGRLDEAKSVLSEMLAIDPDNRDARKILDSLLD